jgi:hypothetical protein
MGTSRVEGVSSRYLAIDYLPGTTASNGGQLPADGDSGGPCGTAFGQLTSVVSRSNFDAQQNIVSEGVTPNHFVNWAKSKTGIP